MLLGSDQYRKPRLVSPLLGQGTPVHVEGSVEGSVEGDCLALSGRGKQITPCRQSHESDNRTDA